MTVKCFILSCRRAVEAQAGAASSPSSFLLLPCNCLQDFFLRGFPYLHWGCRLPTNTLALRQSKFHWAIGAKIRNKLCIPPALPAGWNARKGDRESCTGTLGGWTHRIMWWEETNHSPSTARVHKAPSPSCDSPGIWCRGKSTSPTKPRGGFIKITALDGHSWTVTNTPASHTQAASTTWLQHTGISPGMLKSGGKQEQNLHAGWPGQVSSLEFYPEADCKVQSPQKCRN